MFDVTNRKSYESLNYWIKKSAKHQSKEIFILASKCDLKKEDWFEEAKRTIENKTQFQEISSVTGENINQIFLKVAKNSIPKIPKYQQNRTVNYEQNQKGCTIY